MVFVNLELLLVFFNMVTLNSYSIHALTWINIWTCQECLSVQVWKLEYHYKSIPYFIHNNISSLLRKIEKLYLTVKISRTAVIRVTDSKTRWFYFYSDQEPQINLIWFISRYGGGVVCSTWKAENLFQEALGPHSKSLFITYQIE